MKKLLIVVVFLVTGVVSFAQAKAHKIVFDLNSADTSIQSSVLRQFNNVLTAKPDTELELVCHGQAIFMFVTGRALFEDRYKELKAKGKVAFKVCNNSMRRFNVDKSAIISAADVVPVAILELSERQMDGWSYIKAGQ